MLRKLGSYPRQNGLAVTLRESVRIERTLFILDWRQNVELHRRVHVALNKGEARNATCTRHVLQPAGRNSRAQFRATELPGRRPQLGTAAVVLWNTPYLEWAAHAPRDNSHAVDDGLLQCVGWAIDLSAQQM
ncbi:MAG: Tn3 family transposase [Pseudomonadota bacterium]